MKLLQLLRASKLGYSATRHLLYSRGLRKRSVDTPWPSLGEILRVSCPYCLPSPTRISASSLGIFRRDGASTGSGICLPHRCIWTPPFFLEKSASVQERIALFYQDLPDGRTRTFRAAREGPEVVSETAIYRTSEEAHQDVYTSPMGAGGTGQNAHH